MVDFAPNVSPIVPTQARTIRPNCRHNPSPRHNKAKDLDHLECRHLRRSLSNHNDTVEHDSVHLEICPHDTYAGGIEVVFDEAEDEVGANVYSLKEGIVELWIV